MDRFDRQLRLWGGLGHKCLAGAKICLVTESRNEPLLLELQRHLLLAGVSRFMIFSHTQKAVPNTDQGGGFAFINETEELESLNPQTHLEWDVFSWSELQQQSFRDVSVVLVLNCKNANYLPELTAKRQSSALFPPVLLAGVDWPLAYSYLWLKEPHIVLSANPEYTVPDLRLTEPWPELLQYMDSLDLTVLRADQLAEVPYPVILFKALQMTSRDDEIYPLLQSIDQYYLSLSSEGTNDPNFRQTKRSARQAISSAATCRERVSVLLARLQKNWLLQDWHSHVNMLIATLCKALALYLDTYQQIPLPGGGFPDMEAGTKPYNELRAIYSKKSLQDRQALKQLLAQLGAYDFPEEVLEKFCENINHWTIIEPVAGVKHDLIPEIFCSGAASELTIHGELFAKMSVNELPVVQKLLKLIQRSHNSNGSTNTGTNTLSNSFPATAFLGGVLSQEVIKLVTHQYVPIDNTFIYDMLADESFTLKI
ncbi:uncharacterized protein ZBAI_01473 [Zygosaccharomyces bailii ISA1307]|nr:uncharacterized protein ZBAI_01473 [Zygosaccharomyces bailii ISA1307]